MREVRGGGGARELPGGPARKASALLPVKPPKIRADERAVLVACGEELGRCSWAIFKSNYEGSFWFIRNEPAAPDMRALREGSKAGASDSSAGDEGPQGIGSGDISWRDWRCGVCRTEETAVPGKRTAILTCGGCGTLRCAGGYAPIGGGQWTAKCPGCGRTSRLNEHQKLGDIKEYKPTGGEGPGARALGSSTGSAKRNAPGGGSSATRRLGGGGSSLERR